MKKKVTSSLDEPRVLVISSTISRFRTIFCVLALAAITIFAGAHGTVLYGSVPQGASGMFSASGSEDTENDTHWEILDAGGNVVARRANPAGWSVSFDGAAFTVGCPRSAAIADNYKVRFRTGSSLAGGGSSGTFGVTPDVGGSGGTTSVTGSTTTTGTNGSSVPGCNLWAIPENNQVVIGWAPPSWGTSWVLDRGTSSTTVTQQIASGTGIGTVSYTDMLISTGTTYYYQITFRGAPPPPPANQNGSSRVASATPFNATGTGAVSGIQETRAHVVTSTISATEPPVIAYGYWTDTGGVSHTVTTTQAYWATTDNALNDGLSDPGPNPQPVTASFTDPIAPSHPSFSSAGFAVSSTDGAFTMSVTSTGGATRLFIVSNLSYASTYVNSGGMTVGDFSGSSTTMIHRYDFNAVYAVANAVAVDSRKVYGQPDLAGELPADPNAPQRNVNFNGWVYSGGIFAGNSPTGQSDLSGTARTQFYLLNLPAFVRPVWQDLVICYLGSASNYVSDPGYSLFVPSASDPNLSAPYTTATWANAWNLGSPRSPKVSLLPRPPQGST